MRTQADHAEYDWHVGPDPDMVAGEQIAAELAALEREIGRAYIERCAAEVSISWLSSQPSTDENATAFVNAQKRVIRVEEQLDNLMARWRELHAGAEEER